METVIVTTNYIDAQQARDAHADAGIPVVIDRALLPYGRGRRADGSRSRRTHYIVRAERRIPVHYINYPS